MVRRGQIRPIQIEAKVRQGRKTSTFVTGFETFGLNANELSDELRKLCATSTSGIHFLYSARKSLIRGVVSPLPGKGADLEILVQGVHTKAVANMLLEKGVPAKWIKTAGLKDKKK